MTVLVTGANGLVGHALSDRLAEVGQVVVPVVRCACGLAGEIVMGDIGPDTDWHLVLKPSPSPGESGGGVDAIVHLAARVHVMHHTTQAPLALYRATNTDATLNLARQAAQAGVRRFVFVSTIKVNGEGRDEPYRETDMPAPEDAYAISKWEAEQGLWQIAQETGLEVVILRPPLVYGPAVKANFLRLMQWVHQGWPLPLGAIDNRRSLLYLGNFVDAIRLCIEHPAAAGQTFLIDDGEVVSTPQLIRALAQAMNRPVRLLDVPVPLLQLAGKIIGRSAAITRLTSSLYVDSSAIRSQLNWRPPYSKHAGLAHTVAAYLQDGVSAETPVESI